MMANVATAAEQYLHAYTAASKPRLRWLRETAVATGGPSPDQLDYSRDSLVPLWTWATGQFRLRTEAESVAPRRVPMWYGRGTLHSPSWCSDDTLDLVDGLIYYRAESLLRAVPGARWEVGHSETLGWISEGEPVLIGFDPPISPVRPIIALIGRVYRRLKPDRPNPYGIPSDTPYDLREQFDIDMSMAQLPGTRGPEAR